MSGYDGDGSDLVIQLSPMANGGWRWDIGWQPLGALHVNLDTGCGEPIYSAVNIDTRGWARTHERAERRARKKLARIRARLVALSRPIQILSSSVSPPDRGEQG